MPDNGLAFCFCAIPTMSKQAFLDFCNKAAESDDLAKKIEAAQTPADIVALGAQSGFAFSEADAKEGSQELSEQSERELSEDELTSVSGGSSKFRQIIKIGIAILRLFL